MSSKRRRVRLVFDVAGEPPSVVRVDGNDQRAVSEALAVFRHKVRAAIEAGGCRSFLVGVHVEGAECDHEVGT
jgi:hypothetical protein